MSGTVHRFFDSDIFHSFKGSPVVVAAAVIAVVCILAAAFPYV
jgi:peptide/nickel transport system permease protein